MKSASEIIDEEFDKLYSKFVIEHDFKLPELRSNLKSALKDFVPRDEKRKENGKFNWSDYCATNVNRNQCKEESCVLWNICKIKDLIPRQKVVEILASRIKATESKIVELEGLFHPDYKDVLTKDNMEEQIKLIVCQSELDVLKRVLKQIEELK